MNELVSGILGLALMVLMFFNLVAVVIVTLYARGKIDQLLSNCSIVVDNKVTFGGLGFMGDVHCVGVVGLLLLWPGMFSKKTVVDMQQVSAFPKGLKYSIVIIWSVGHVLVLALFAYGTWLRFFEGATLG